MISWMLTVGAITSVAGGVVLALILAATASWTLGVVGSKAFKRITRIYSIYVVWYWLNRLEAEGTHCFEKASKESKCAT